MDLEEFYAKYKSSSARDEANREAFEESVHPTPRPDTIEGFLKKYPKMDSVEAWQAKYPIVTKVGKAMQSGAEAVKQGVEKLFPDPRDVGGAKTMTSFLADPVISAGKAVEEFGQQGAGYLDTVTANTPRGRQAREDVTNAALIGLPAAKGAKALVEGVAATPGPAAGTRAAQKGVFLVPTAEEINTWRADKAAGASERQLWDKHRMYEDPNEKILFKEMGDNTSRATHHEAAFQNNAALTARLARVQEQISRATGENKKKLLNEKDDLLEKIFSVKNTTGLKMGQVLDHPELYDRHPELKDYSVRIGSTREMDGADAHFDSDKGEIVVSRSMWTNKDKTKFHDTLIHEVQHFLDEARFADSGANSRHIMNEARNRMAVHQANIDQHLGTYHKESNVYNTLKLIQRNPGMTVRQAMDAAMKEGSYFGAENAFNTPQMEKYISQRVKFLAPQGEEGAIAAAKDDALAARAEWMKHDNKARGEPITDSTAYDVYRRNIGETRARNAATRRSWSDESRGIFRPERTQDVPFEDQLTSKQAYGGSIPARKFPSASAPAPIPMGEALKGEDYTLKTLERLPMNKGMIPVQTIREQMKRPDVTQAEKDLLESILPQDGTVSPKDLVEQFKMASKNIRTTPTHSNEYSDYGLENIGRDTQGRPWVGKPANLRLADTRTTIHELPPGIAPDDPSHHFQNPNYFAHTRAFEENGIPHVVELQSDLMQRKSVPVPAEDRAKIEANIALADKHMEIIQPKDYERHIEDMSFDQLADITQKLDAEGTGFGDTRIRVPFMGGTRPMWLSRVFDFYRDAPGDVKSKILGPARLALREKMEELVLWKRDLENRLKTTDNKGDLSALKKNHPQRLVREELAMVSKKMKVDERNAEEMRGLIDALEKENDPNEQGYLNFIKQELFSTEQRLKNGGRVRFATPDTVAKVEGWPEPRTDTLSRIAKRKERVEQLKRDVEYLSSKYGPTSQQATSAKKSLEFDEDILAEDENILKNLGPERFRKEHQGIYDNYKDLEKYLKSIGGVDHVDPHGHTWIEVPVRGEKSPLKSGRTPLFTMAGGPVAGGAGAAYNAKQQKDAK